jgi:phosphopantothenoylcysteine decarboxylase
MKHKILLGLTGSVASVLYEKLITEITKIGDLSVIVTEKALPFIEIPKLCDVLDGYGFLYIDHDEWQWNRAGGTHKKWKKNDPVLHIQLRDQASALVIAPCSANTLAKLASGLCDNLLTTVARAWDLQQRPLILAPAMNTHMWDHPITEHQIAMLTGWGVHTINPQKKMLACGTNGMGAMIDIESIVSLTEDLLRWRFPINFEDCASVPIGDHPGAFATQRKHERHTGVDLYTHEGVVVHAVESGKVVGIEHFTGEWDKSPWWNNTDCILIEGATGVVCYGEVEVSDYIKVGDSVMQGQYLAKVKPVLPKGKERKDIPGHSLSMLHMELYPHGTTKASNGFEENLLHDPTPFLLNCQEGYRLQKLMYAKTHE